MQVQAGSRRAKDGPAKPAAPRRSWNATPAKSLGLRGQRGAPGRLQRARVAGTDRPLASVEVLGGSGVAGAWGSLGTAALAAVQREATQMIKGTEGVISEGRLKGLNIYIAWLRAVHGEIN